MNVPGGFVDLSVPGLGFIKRDTFHTVLTLLSVVIQHTAVGSEINGKTPLGRPRVLLTDRGSRREPGSSPVRPL